MTNRLKTEKSGFGLSLQVIGLFQILGLIGLWIFFLYQIFGSRSLDFDDEFPAVLMLGTIYLLPSGCIFFFLGTLIQKVWNIEFYLAHLANNTYSVPVPKQTFQEKPISAPKEPNKPSNPQSDMSKYAPPK
jgi:hypothetical protein